jgi:hypothetical protein
LQLVLEKFLIQTPLLPMAKNFEGYPSIPHIQIYLQRKYDFFLSLDPDAQIRISGSTSSFEISKSLAQQRNGRAAQIYFFIDTFENGGSNIRLESWANFNNIGECFTDFFLGHIQQCPVVGVDSSDLSLRKRIFFYLIESGGCKSFEKIFVLLKDLIFLCFISRVMIFSDCKNPCLATLDEQLAREPVSNFFGCLKSWKKQLKTLRIASEGSIIPRQVVFYHPSNSKEIVIEAQTFPIELISLMYFDGLREFGSLFSKLCDYIPFSKEGPSSATMKDICCNIFARDVIDNFSSTGPVLENGYHTQIQMLLFVGFNKARESFLGEIKDLLHRLSCTMLFLLHIGGGNPARARDYVGFSFLGINRNAFFLKEQVFSLLHNTKVEAMLKRQLDLIPRGYPANLADYITRFVFVVSPLQAFVNLYEAQNESERTIVLENSKQNFFSFNGRPPKGKSSLRYFLNLELTRYAEKHLLGAAAHSSPVLSIKSYRHLQAFTITRELSDGNLVLTSEVEAELQKSIGRQLKELPLIHSLLVMTAVSEQSEQGGRSEGTFLHQYGNGFNNILLGGTLVTAKMIQKYISVSKFSHHLMGISSPRNPKSDFEKGSSSGLTVVVKEEKSRFMKYLPFNEAFAAASFLPLAEGGFNQLEFAESLYSCITGKENALLIAPTGSGKTFLMLTSILVGTQQGNQVFLIVLPTATMVTQVILKANAIREGSAMSLTDFARNNAAYAENARNLFDAGCVNAQLRLLVCTPEGLSVNQKFISTRLFAFNLIYAIFWDDCQDGGDPFCFRAAFTNVAQLFALAVTPGVQIPFMICMSSTIPFAMEAEIVKNLFVAPFLKYHNNTLPRVLRNGSAVSRKLSWNLIKAINLYDSLLECILLRDMPGDVMVFVPDYHTRDSLKRFFENKVVKEKMERSKFREIMFIDRELENKNKGLFEKISLTMQHVGEENPFAKRNILVTSQICGSGIDFPFLDKVIILTACFSICAGFQSGGRCGRNGREGKVFVISENCQNSKDPLINLFLTKDTCLQNLLSIYFDGPPLIPGNSPMCENCSFCFERERVNVMSLDSSSKWINDKNDQRLFGDAYSGKKRFESDEKIIVSTAAGGSAAAAGDFASTPTSVSKKPKTDAVIFSNLTTVVEIQEKAKKFIGNQKIRVTVNVLLYMKFLLRLEQNCILEECSSKHTIYGECILLPRNLCFGCGLSRKQTSNNQVTAEIYCETLKCPRVAISSKGGGGVGSGSKKEWICVNCFSHCSFHRDVCADNTRENPKLLMVLVMHLCYFAKFDFRTKWSELLETFSAEERFSKFRTLFNECNARIGNKLRISLWEQ